MGNSWMHQILGQISQLYHNSLLREFHYNIGTNCDFHVWCYRDRDRFFTLYYSRHLLVIMVYFRLTRSIMVSHRMIKVMRVIRLIRK